MTRDQSDGDDEVASELLKEDPGPPGSPLRRCVGSIARRLESPVEGIGVLNVVMAEFRDGRTGALVWSDGPGTWGTGGWKSLSREGMFLEDVARMRPVAYRLGFGPILDLLVSLPRPQSANGPGVLLGVGPDRGIFPSTPRDIQPVAPIMPIIGNMPTRTRKRTKGRWPGRLGVAALVLAFSGCSSVSTKITGTTRAGAEQLLEAIRKAMLPCFSGT